jgi:Abnormal spindle-like microcephaly-assoc'd, ASPM-SPD-2-Hydin
MKRCLLLTATLLPLSAFAQIQVFEYNGSTETPVNGLYNVGSASPGDTIQTRFRVRNVGVATATLQKLSLGGSGFQITAAPSLPYIIAPGSETEFDVSFAPTAFGTYSAFMAVNTLNITLQGNSVASAVLTVAGSNTPLAAGATVQFGSVTVGQSAQQVFTLSNPGTTTLTVHSIVVSGTGFSGPAGVALPVQLGAGKSVSFSVTFQPPAGQAAQGTLVVDGRSFNLAGLGLTPSLATLPPVTMNLASTAGASAQQNSLSINLSAASQVSGTGTVTMTFTPSVAGVTDDPTVQFLSGKLRAATVNFTVGSSVGTFNGQSSIGFSTGATAGTITFSLALDGQSQTQIRSLTVTPAPVYLDTATGLRKAGELDISLTGFDNTYSASQMSFTFYDLSGKVVQPGAIPVSVGPAFQQYFASTRVGGMFALLAKFPVTGDTTQIGSFTMQMTNSAGNTTVQNVQIAGSTPPQPIPTASAPHLIR